MIGRVHSVQSLGAVDGPGIRYVVFLQGCPLRCAYCHNPDTWSFEGGTGWEAGELAKEILRYRPYFGKNGGVTLSGGEPLTQPDFVEELFRLLRGEGIHTALDTSGIGDFSNAERILDHTDLVLCDLKFLTPSEYQRYCRGDFSVVERFLELTARKNVPLWIRHVVVPGLNDSPDDLRGIRQMAQRYPNLEKIEWLPFHNLCLEKYDAMGVEFPLKDAPAMDARALEALIKSI